MLSHSMKLTHTLEKISLISSTNPLRNIIKSQRHSGKRAKRSPTAGVGLDLVTELIKSGKDISTAGGNIKEFVYAMAAPILTALSKDRNIHAIKGVT